jgi:hypothetical protein
MTVKLSVVKGKAGHKRPLATSVQLMLTVKATAT